MRSAYTWLPFKYVFQYACSLTSLLKSDCAAIDSLHSDKQLRARTCQPVNHVFLTFPSALRISSSPSLFLRMLAQRSQRKLKAYYSPAAQEYKKVKCVTESHNTKSAFVTPKLALG